MSAIIKRIEVVTARERCNFAPIGSLRQHECGGWSFVCFLPHRRRSTKIKRAERARDDGVARSRAWARGKGRFVDYVQAGDLLAFPSRYPRGGVSGAAPAATATTLTTNKAMATVARIAWPIRCSATTLDEG